MIRRGRAALRLAWLAAALVLALTPASAAQSRATARLQSTPRLTTTTAARPSLLRRAFTRRAGAGPLARGATALDPRAVPTEPHLFAREPFAPGEHLPVAYHANAIEAGTGFAHWVQDAPAIDGASLREATEAMHETSALGAGASPRPYNAGRYRSDAVHPGRVRQGGQPHYVRPGAVAYAQRVAALLRVAPPGDGRLPIRGVPEDDQPVNFGWRHIYPSGESLDRYFASAATTLSVLRSVPNRPATRAAAEDLIADYYHTMVNARPFDQINNSLVMNQVNVLLRQRGEPGVAHGHLDFLAHHLDPTSFRTAFRAHLAGRLPSPAQVGVAHIESSRSGNPG